MSNTQDMSEGGTGLPDFPGLPGLGDEVESVLLGSKGLSYAQPTLADRVKTFFDEKYLADWVEQAVPSPSHSGNDGKSK